MDLRKQDQYITRDTILKLLSDEETARVSTAETGQRLADGEEYLDLQHLEKGVIHAYSAPTPMKQILPKNAVSKETWSKILTHLAPPSVVRKL
jgi:hypothetical protein